MGACLYSAPPADTWLYTGHHWWGRRDGRCGGPTGLYIGVCSGRQVPLMRTGRGLAALRMAGAAGPREQPSTEQVPPPAGGAGSGCGARSDPAAGPQANTPRTTRGGGGCRPRGGPPPPPKTQHNSKQQKQVPRTGAGAGAGLMHWPLAPKIHAVTGFTPGITGGAPQRPTRRPPPE